MTIYSEPLRIKVCLSFDQSTRFRLHCLFSDQQYRLAKDIGVPAMRINRIVHGQRGISADTALRLARYFGMSVEFWTGIQTHYEVELAKMKLGSRLEEEVKVFAAA